MIGHNIRVSRIAYPRATVWTMALLVLVFLSFGMVAEACLTPAATEVQVSAP